MRTIRTLAAGAACVALLPAVGSAQNGRHFEDSWFWGAKSGITMLTSASEKINAPTFGAEWLITRSRGALYFSVEQAFFDTEAGVYDPTSTGSVRAVEVSDLRRYNLSLYGFPKSFGILRPYAGIGLALNVLQEAAPMGTFSSPQIQDSVFSRVDQETSRAAVVMTAGLQAQYSRFSIFGQVSTMPTRRNFLINGASNTTMIEAGIRYNLATAIEKIGR